MRMFVRTSLRVINVGQLTICSTKEHSKYSFIDIDILIILKLLFCIFMFVHSRTYNSLGRLYILTIIYVLSTLFEY